jgi:hypothetical protein
MPEDKSKRVLRETKGGDPAVWKVHKNPKISYPTIDHARFFGFKAKDVRHRKGSRLIVSFAYRLDNLKEVQDECEKLGWTVYVHEDKVTEVVWGEYGRKTREFMHLVLLLEKGVPVEECVLAILRNEYLVEL